MKYILIPVIVTIILYIIDVVGGYYLSKHIDDKENNDA